MVKCKFGEIWLESSTFGAWLKDVENNESEARCTSCKNTLGLGALGVKTLKFHGKSTKHKSLPSLNIVHIGSMTKVRSHANHPAKTTVWDFPSNPLQFFFFEE